MTRLIGHTHSIFEEPWWLDATSPGRWDAVEIEESGRVIARLPFVVKKRFGLRMLVQPVLTQTLGPWVEPAEGPQSDQLAREKDLHFKLIERLPKHDVFRQNFHSNVTNWLPFHWQGFSQTTRYSYVLGNIGDTEATFKRMSKSTRKQIRRAQREVDIVASNDVSEVLELANKTFHRQGLERPYSDDYLRGIDEAARKHAHAVALYAVDATGKMHSAVYVVGDERRAYSLVSGNDPELRRSQSGQLLRWEAIKAAAAFTNIYDFEGSMLQGVEEFYRNFGSVQVPYFHITRMGRRGKLAEAARKSIR